MARPKKYPGQLVAQLDPMDQAAQDSIINFGDEIVPPTRQMDTTDPVNFNYEPPPPDNEPLPEEMIDPNNGVPTSITQPKSAADQVLDLLGSDEYKARQKELQDRARQALEEQRAGVQSNEQDIQNFQNQGNKLNIRPLAALADSWYGTNLSAGIPQQMSPEELQLKLMALKDQLQKQKQGISQEELALLKEQLGGAMSPLAQLKAASTMDYQKRYSPGGQMEHLAEYRTAQGARDKILQKLSNNKDLGARLNAYQTIDNALSNMASGKIRTPQQLQDMQDALIAGLGMSRGQSGVNERAERRFDTLSLKGSRMMQFLNSKPEDVMANKALIGHLQDLAKSEQANVRRQYEQRLNALASGYKRLLDKPEYADIRQDVQDAINSYAGQFESPEVPDLTKLKKGQSVEMAAPKAAAQVSAPPVDADLDSMTPEQLQQWMNAHGK